MLRISAHDEGESTSLTIEGNLTSTVASELEGAWQGALERQPTKTIVVKLAAVSFVDAESRQLLTRMRRQGVQLVPTGCFMRAIVQQIEAEVAKDAATSQERA